MRGLFTLGRGRREGAELVWCGEAILKKIEKKIKKKLDKGRGV